MGERFGGEKKRIDDVKAMALGDKPEEKEKEWKTEKLHENIEQNYEAFSTKLVQADSLLDQADAKIKSPDLRALFFSGGMGHEKNIRTFLLRAASSAERALLMQRTDQGAEAELSTISASAGMINNEIGDIKDSLSTFGQIEKIKSKYVSEANPAINAVKEVLKNKESLSINREKIIIRTKTAIEALSHVKSLVNDAGFPKFELARETLELERKKVNKDLESMAGILEYYEVKDFAGAGENVKYLVFNAKTGEVTYTDAYNKLPEEKKQEILGELYLIKKNISDQIDEKSLSETSQWERSFFEGKRLLAAGNYVEAKARFIQYRDQFKKEHQYDEDYTLVIPQHDFYVEVTQKGKGELTPVRPETTERRSECNEYLKQIAFLELEQAVQIFKALKSGVTKQWAGLAGNLKMGCSTNEAKKFLQVMEKRLQEARGLIEQGQFVDINEIKSKIMQREDLWSSEKGRGFANIFDVFAIQQKIHAETDPEKKKQLILDIAQRAYDLEIYDLAKYFYDMYFQPELKEAARNVSRVDIEQKMRADGDFNAQLDKQMLHLRDRLKEKYKEENDGAEISGKDLEAVVAGKRDVLFKMAVDSAYQRAIKANLHEKMQGATGPKAKVWNDMYSNTFVNLDYFKDRNWYQLWKFTPLEWDGFVTMLIVDIGTLVVSGGFGNIGKMLAQKALLRGMAGKVVHHLIAREAQQLLKKHGFRAAVKFLCTELGYKRAAALGLVGIAVESGISSGVYAALNSVMTNADYSSSDLMKAWGKKALTLGVVRVANFGMGGSQHGQEAFRKNSEKILKGASKGAIGALTGIGMMAMTGHDLSDEQIRKMLASKIIYSVGGPLLTKAFQVD